MHLYWLHLKSSWIQVFRCINGKSLHVAYVIFLWKQLAISINLTIFFHLHKCHASTTSLQIPIIYMFKWVTCSSIFILSLMLTHQVLCLKLIVVTQFWIHQDFLECYFISIITYKNPKKIRKSLKLKKIYIFLESTASFHRNRVHRVNTGQTMLTRKKNEFQAVSGQNRVHLSQYGSNHVDRGKKWVSGHFGSKLLFFWSKLGLSGWYPSKVFFSVFQHNFRSLKWIFSGWIGFF